MKSPFTSAHKAVERGTPVTRALAHAASRLGSPIEAIARVDAPAPVLPAARRPVVSIITACYNYGRFLPQTIDSALAQEGVEVEVIVVDDASSDDSAEIAERYAAADSRVTALRSEVNAGKTTAFNRGLAIATGEFIAPLDADDLLTPGSLARSIALFDAFPSVGLVYGHPRHFETHVPPVAHLGEVSWTVWSGREWIAARCQLGNNCITNPEALVRREVLDRVGGMSDKLGFATDMEMWLRIAAASDVARVNGADQAFHREHSAAMSVTVAAGGKIDLLERRIVFDSLFDGVGADLPDVASLRDSAMRTLASEALLRAAYAYETRRVDAEPVDWYTSFALEVFPGAADLPQWRRLQRRRRIDPRLTPAFLGVRTLRRAIEELRYLQWVDTGL
jgi:glycosyltransferase involved in cell wall biosynthesis